MDICLLDDLSQCLRGLHRSAGTGACIHSTAFWVTSLCSMVDLRPGKHSLIDFLPNHNQDESLGLRGPNLSGE